MSDGDDSTPRRFRRMRFSPLRDLLPWVAVALGIVVAIRALIGSMDPIFLILGPALSVFGIAAFFFVRWIGRRGM